MLSLSKRESEVNRNSKFRTHPCPPFGKEEWPANSVMRFRLLIGALIISVVAPLAWGAETKIVILHTNDLHGHITSWQGWEGDLAGKTVDGFDRSPVEYLKAAMESPRQSRRPGC